MERVIIDQGKEHVIFDSYREGWVLKKPKMLQVLLLNILYKFPGDVIKREFTGVGAHFEKAGIIIPETKIFSMRNGYVIAQKKLMKIKALDCMRY